jgi:hypothetical protein
MGTGATLVVTVPQGIALGAAGIWWLVGWALRDFVFELRRAPNHLNVVVGFGGGKADRG